MAGRRHAVDRERQQGCRRLQKDDGQSRQQYRERDLVGRALALGTLDHRDHAIDKGLTAEEAEQREFENVFGVGATRDAKGRLWMPLSLADKIAVVE